MSYLILVFKGYIVTVIPYTHGLHSEFLLCYREEKWCIWEYKKKK